MNILIIGGLGYLGSDLSDNLRQFCTVTILDPDLYNSAYKEQCNGVEIIKENLCTWDQGDRKYDCVLVCSEVDVEDFYDAEVYRGYLFSYSRALKKLAEVNNESMILYFTSPQNQMGDEHKKWAKQFIDHFSDHKKFTAMECPMLYGDNVVVRSDTTINAAIHSFMVYSSYMLNENPFSLIKFQNILSYAKDVCDYIVNGEYTDNADCLQAIALVNAIQWSMVGGNECQLSIASSVANASEFEPGSVSLSKPEEFKSHINMMINALQNGMTNELMKEQSDRTTILRSALVAKKVNEKLSV